VIINYLISFCKFFFWRCIRYS